MKYKKNMINNKTIGEEIPTEFKWISLDMQKKNANRLSKLTNKKIKKIRSN